MSARRHVLSFYFISVTSLPFPISNNESIPFKKLFLIFRFKMIESLLFVSLKTCLPICLYICMFEKIYLNIRILGNYIYMFENTYVWNIAYMYV